MTQNREELLKHLAASLKDAKEDGGAILLVGAGISVSAGIPPAQKLMKIAIENFPNYFTEEERRLAQEDLSQLQYNDIMTKLSNVKRKELFRWFIEGNKEKGIEKAKLNFAHIAIAELLKQGYFSRVLTVNFDPLLIHACYMVGMYPLPAIYDLGSVERVNPELFNDPSLIYLNGQHVGQVQRNTTNQLTQHDPILQKVAHSTGCTRTWVVAGYSGENDPLMTALNELRPYSNWLYWLEYSDKISCEAQHQFLKQDEECKVIFECDADETFMQIAELLNCSLDFIERPHKELELYLAEIKFDSLRKQKGFSFQSKIKEYIKLLTSKNFQATFLTIDMIEVIIDYINEKNPEPSRVIEICTAILEKFPQHKDALVWLAHANSDLANLKEMNNQKSPRDKAIKIYKNLARSKDSESYLYQYLIETIFDQLRITSVSSEREQLLIEILSLINEAKGQPNFTDKYEEFTELELKAIKLKNDLEQI